MSKTKNRPARETVERRGALMLLGDGLLLFLALTGTCFSFLTAYRVQALGVVLLEACVGLTLLFLAIFSMKRLRWLPLLGVGGACALVVWRFWDGLTFGEIWLRCAVVNTLADELRFLDHIAPIAQLRDEVWVLWGTVLLVLALTGLAFLLGWAIVRARSGLLVVLFTLPLLLPALFITVTPGWLPLMSLLAVYATMLLTGLCAKGDRQGGARFTLLALPASAALLALLTAAMPREGYVQPKWASQAQQDMVNGLSRMDWGNITLQGLLPGPFGGFTAAGSVETVDLEAAGPLQYSGRTVLRVRTKTPGKLYLRGYSAGVYTGSGWEQLPEEVYQELDQPPGAVRGWVLQTEMQDSGAEQGKEIHLDTAALGGQTHSGGEEEPTRLMGYEPLNFPALADQHTGYQSITVENLGAPGGCVYFPYQLLTNSDELAGAKFVNDAYLARGRNVWEHTLYYKPLDLTDTQDLTGDERRAELEYRQFVYDHYLDLPDDFETGLLDPWFRDVLSSIAIEVPWDDSLPRQYKQELYYAKVVAALLDASTRYDPDTPALGGGEDFVRCFLLDNQRGYCMHYASAATLLLRWYGVPARYVSGFVVNVPKSGTVDVPDSAAHAWVEIYLDGYGWYPVDVTPGYQGNELAGVELDPVPTPSPTPSPTPTPAPTPKPSTEPGATPAPTATAAPEGEQAGWELDGRWLIALAALAAVVFLFLFRRALAQERRVRKLEQPDTNRAVLYGYGYYQRLRRWGGQPSERVEELARKAKFSQHTLTEEEREAVRAWLHRESGRVEAVLPWWKRLLFRYVWGLR